MLKTSNTFFIVFFVCEGSMKLIAYGFKYYWYINWNKFDFIVVFLSLLVVDESWLEKLGINPSALRIIRVMRLFRLIKVSDSLRSLLKTIIIAMANILFADDTTPFIEGTDITHLTNIWTEKFKLISDWIDHNSLILNYDKTKFMFLTNKRVTLPLSIKINTCAVEVVDSFVFGENSY